MSFKTSKYASSFSPQNIPGLALWLDAADYSAFTLSGTSVTSWRDKSGNGCNAIGNSNTGIYSSNGFNSLPTVQFTPSNNMKVPMPSGTFPTGIAVFMVYQKTGANNTFDMGLDRSAGGTPSPFNSRTSDPSETYRFIGGAGGFPSTPVETSTNLWRRTTPTVLFMGIFSNTPTTWNESINGVFTTYTTSPTTYVDGADGIYIGARSDFSTVMRGNISEIIAYRVPSITSQERQQVESYLAWKWGLAGNLPTAHPYRTAPIFTRPFNPLDVSGCAIWLDAADYRTFTFSSGSNVSQWNDKSGSGLNFSTTSGTVTYSNQTLAIPSGAIMTSVSNFSLTGNTYVFAVARLGTGGNMFMAFSSINPAGSAGDFSIRYGNNGILIGVPNNGGNTNDFGNSNYYVNGSFQPSFTSEVYTARHILSGQSINSGGSTAVTVSSSFYGRFFVGDVNEILFYSSPPSTSQRQQIENYLAEKWGLRSSLSTSNALRLYRALSPVFNPTMIPGCTLWLDGADRNSFVFSGGSTSNIQTWLDKSTNGFHANATNNPTWSSSQTRVEFNGTTQYMSNTSYTLNLSQRSIFIVMEERTRFNSAGVFTQIPNPSGQLDYVSTTGMAISTNNGLQFYWSNGNYSSIIGNSVLIAKAIYNDNMSGTSGSSFLNGSNTANSNVTAGTPGTCGGYLIGQRWLGALSLDYPLNAFLYEILVYSSPLTQAQRQQVEGYLAWKWGLVGSVSSNHPYKTIKP